MIKIEDALAVVGDRIAEYGQFQNRKHFDVPKYQEGVAKKTEAIANAVRAYGDARELKGHVDACKATNSEKALCGTAWRGMVWYCDKAREIEEVIG